MDLPQTIKPKFMVPTTLTLEKFVEVSVVPHTLSSSTIPSRNANRFPPSLHTTSLCYHARARTFASGAPPPPAIPDAAPSMLRFIVLRLRALQVLRSKLPWGEMALANTQIRLTVRMGTVMPQQNTVSRCIPSRPYRIPVIPLVTQHQALTSSAIIFCHPRAIRCRAPISAQQSDRHLLSFLLVPTDQRSSKMGALYEAEKDEDGFLYVSYSDSWRTQTSTDLAPHELNTAEMMSYLEARSVWQRVSPSNQTRACA